MKKSKNGYLYAIVWLALVAVFNVIVFVSPSEINGVSKFTTTFWIGYGAIMGIFVIQFLATYMVFKKSNSLTALFYRIPLIKVSIVTLIFMVVLALPFMIIPQIPSWIGIIVVSIGLLFTIIAYAKAAAGPAVVEAIDQAVKTQTAFTKLLIADAEALYNSQTEDDKIELTKKVYELIRYSDPMSVDAIKPLEMEIEETFREFKTVIEENKMDEANAKSKRLSSLINERNTKIRILK